MSDSQCKNPLTKLLFLSAEDAAGIRAEKNPEVQFPAQRFSLHFNSALLCGKNILFQGVGNWIAGYLKAKALRNVKAKYINHQVSKAQGFTKGSFLNQKSEVASLQIMFARASIKCISVLCEFVFTCQSDPNKIMGRGITLKNLV